MTKPPPQPTRSSWRFVEDLAQRKPRRLSWNNRQRRKNEADLSCGVQIDWRFPDPAGILETARQEFILFLEENHLLAGNGYQIKFLLKNTAEYEAYVINVKKEGCYVWAADTEGMRRAVYFLEDELMRANGPFLKIGTVRRRPIIKTRISRCFFSPINRPPQNCDELLDSHDYYPDAYLNKLAHHGVNAIWLAANFKDLCTSRIFPEFGKDAPRRLEKLAKTVNQCARFGIGVYILCMEPQGFSSGSGSFCTRPKRVLERFPELAGHQHADYTFFCTSSPTGQKYLEEATYKLFSNIPTLAGLINITMGEGVTNCYSHYLYDIKRNTCPRCSVKEPWQVFDSMFAAMRRGLSKAKSTADLISWPYIPGVHTSEEKSMELFSKKIAAIAEYTSKEAVFLCNFESLGRHLQLGIERLVRDYSLAYIGPSSFFQKCARAAQRGGGEIAAKIQVGCSHELATVPCVPVPGNLFRKYREMQKFGVTRVMQCWYFGNYPSLMTKAAGELAFAPLQRSESEFLTWLAVADWGSDAKTVAEAWGCFADAYRNFPTNINFSWYGPLHDAISWPLFLKPVDQPISPSWKLGQEPSGDRIGECIGYSHSLEEILLLCERMRSKWKAGLNKLTRLRHKYRNHLEQRLEIGLAEAIGLQIDSAKNVLRFYSLREDLYRWRPFSTRVLLCRLKELKTLVRHEIRNSRRLAELARQDSRLGFHSEAEGYKYFPSLLDWRCGELQRLLTTDFPDIERDVRKKIPLFPEYSGRSMGEKATKFGCWEECLPEGKISEGWLTKFKVENDMAHLIFHIECAFPLQFPMRRKSDNPLWDDCVVVLIEPRRLWPAHKFCVDITGMHLGAQEQQHKVPHWKSRVQVSMSFWRAVIRIPLVILGEHAPKLRLNVMRITSAAGNFSWIQTHPLSSRLIFGTCNPRDLGWLDGMPNQNKQI